MRGTGKVVAGVAEGFCCGGKAGQEGGLGVEAGEHGLFSGLFGGGEAGFVGAGTAPALIPTFSQGEKEKGSCM